MSLPIIIVGFFIFRFFISCYWLFYHPHQLQFTKSYIRYQARNSGESGGRPPLPFFENRRNCPDFGKKSHDCVHLLVKFSIENIVLRVSRRKNSKIFPCGAFSVLLMKCLSESPNSTKPLLPWKISGCAPGYISNIPWFQFLL